MLFGFKTCSLLFRVLSVAFALTLFADATNIIDLFTQSLVMHGDSDEDVQLVKNTGLSDSFSASSSRSNTQIPLDSRNVILDQDSPSLAADVLPFSFTCFNTLSTETVISQTTSRNSSPTRFSILRI